MSRSIAVERLGPLPVARPGDRILGPSHVYADGEVDVPAVDALGEGRLMVGRWPSPSP